MKNRKLLIIGLLFTMAFVQAKESNITTKKWDYNSPYNHQRPITFTENGIKFYVFQNGEIDFIKSHTNTYYGNAEYYYRNGKRFKKSRRTKRTGRTRYYNDNNRLKVSYDYYGRVKRVGKVFINYNYYGKVVNIGSVSMFYRRNRLTRVGGLKIIKDRYGYTQYIGNVKPLYNDYNTGYYEFYNDYFYDDYVYNYDDEFFNDDDFYDEYEQFEEDDDYYYYRSKNKKTKRGKRGKSEKKSKMLKRKKKKSEK